MSRSNANAVGILGSADLPVAARHNVRLVGRRQHAPVALVEASRHDVHPGAGPAFQRRTAARPIESAFTRYATQSANFVVSSELRT